MSGGELLLAGGLALFHSHFWGETAPPVTKPPRLALLGVGISIAFALLLGEGVLKALY